MKFEIDFNREANNNFLIKELGAKVESFEDFDRVTIEINSFEELEELLKKVNKGLNMPIYKEYLAVISFDPPSIYLDNDV
jgi:hypothetical protein